MGQCVSLTFQKKFMKTEFKSKVELIRYYADEEKCKELLAQQRWGDTVCCIHCGSCKVYTTNRGYKCAEKTCHKKFTVISGTIFENTKIKLNVWFEAIFVITAHKKGISSHQLAKDIGVSQKTAWFINHRIREMLTAKNPALLENMVEVDESWIGGKSINKHRSKKVRGRGGVVKGEKEAVIGLVERGGMVIAYHIPEVNKDIVLPIINQNIKAGSRMVTDENSVYRKVSSHNC